MRFDLFSSGRLYIAMKKGGYPDLPSERTLRDWIRNDSPPKSARLFVAELLTLPDTTKDAPPDWARRQAVRLRAVGSVVGVTAEDLAQAESDEAAEEALRAAGAGPTLPGSGGGAKATSV